MIMPPASRALLKFWIWVNRAIAPHTVPQLALWAIVMSASFAGYFPCGVQSVDRIIYAIFQRFNLEWKTRNLNGFCY